MATAAAPALANPKGQQHRYCPSCRTYHPSKHTMFHVGDQHFHDHTDAKIRASLLANRTGKTVLISITLACGQKPTVCGGAVPRVH